MATLPVAIDARQAEVGATKFQGATDRMRRAAKQSRNELGRFTKQTNAAGTASANAAKFVKQLFVGFTAVAAVRSAIRTIADYQESLAVLQGVAIRTNQTLAEQERQYLALDATAKQLGATTRFTATEASQGLLFLARAGFSVEESIAAIPATLNLAVAGVLELGEAADFASNIVSQFGLAASQTERVVDAMVITSNRSNTSTRQLAEALKFAGPIAGALGEDVETAASAIGVLGNQGIQASMAGTNLRAVMLKLADPTSEAQETFARLGLSVAEMNPEANSLVSILEKLGASQARVSDFAKIFGIRNAAAAKILSSNTEEITRLIREQEIYAGESQRMADIIDRTLAGSFRALKSAIQGAFIEIGESGFGGALQTTVDTITGAIRILIGMEEEVTKNAKAAQFLANTIKAVGKTLAIFAAYKIAVTSASLVTAIFNAVLTANPIGLVIVAIGGLLIAYENLKDKTITIMDTTATVQDFVIGAWEHLRDKTIFIWKTVAAVWDFVWQNAIIPATKVAVDWLRENVIPVVQRIAKAFFLALPAILRVMKSWTNTMIAAFESVIDVIDILFDRMKRAIDLAVTIGSGALTGGAQGFLRALIGNKDEALELLDVAGLAEEIVGTVSENFEKDYVGGIVDATQKAIERFRMMWTAFLQTKWGRDFDRFFIPWRQLDDVLERASQRAANRELWAKVGDTVTSTIQNAVASAFTGLPPQVITLNFKTGGSEDPAGGGPPDLKTLLGDDGGADAAAARIKERIDAIKFETSLTGLNNQERERAIANAAFERDIRQAEITDLELIASLRQELNENLDELFAAERTQQLADNLADVTGRALEDIALGFTSAKDAGRAFFAEINRLIFNTYITQPFQNFLSGLLPKFLPTPSAMGNIFKTGNLVPFATGGVVTGPTLFPLAGGKTGIMGESGKEEAVMPLKRINGRLGVEAETSGGGGPINVTMVLPGVREPQGFIRSRRQIEADLRDIARRSL